MAKSATQVLAAPARTLEWGSEIIIAISASLFVALCARCTALLAATPVPVTLQNFGVLLVGMALGRKRAFAAWFCIWLKARWDCRYLIHSGRVELRKSSDRLADISWPIRLSPMWLVSSWSVEKRPSFVG